MSAKYQLKKYYCMTCGRQGKSASMYKANVLGHTIRFCNREHYKIYRDHFPIPEPIDDE